MSGPQRPPLDLAPIEARLAAVVRAEQEAGVVGEWREYGLAVVAETVDGKKRIVMDPAGVEFMAACRQDVPALLAEVCGLRIEAARVATRHAVELVEAGEVAEATARRARAQGREAAYRRAAVLADQVGGSKLAETYARLADAAAHDALAGLTPGEQPLVRRADQ